MYELQTSVKVGRASFGIRNRGDFRMVLDCFEALDDVELTESERIYAALIVFYEDFDEPEDFPDNETVVELIKAMFEFFNQGEEIPSNTQNIRVLDWQKDSNLISSAINNVANTEIRSMEYVHWWTFLGWFMAIGECPLATVSSIRLKTAKGQKLEDYEKKFKRDNPQYFSVDLRTPAQKEADDYIQSLWGST